MEDNVNTSDLYVLLYSEENTFPCSSCEAANDPEPVCMHVSSLEIILSLKLKQ